MAIFIAQYEHDEILFDAVGQQAAEVLAQREASADNLLIDVRRVYSSTCYQAD